MDGDEGLPTPHISFAGDPPLRYYREKGMTPPNAFRERIVRMLACIILAVGPALVAGGRMGWGPLRPS